MKRGGLTFAALFVISGILRIVGPGSLPQAEPARNGSQAAKPTAKLVSATQPTGPKGTYDKALAEQIAESFACSDETRTSQPDDPSRWNVPPASRKDVQIVVAIVPDPVHTHLSLFFDRTVESLEQAAQQQGDYAFDRAILPWEYVSHKSSDGPAARQKEIVMALVVGFVYAEMHRDAILSRLTSTTAGELGWDFWWKFISAGAIPVFSLLATQFPEINKILFSWIEPLLQSTK